MEPARYTAWLVHNNIGSQSYDLESTNLEAAKAEANRALGDGFEDHEISIYDNTLPEPDQNVATRRIGDDESEWTDY